MDRAKKEVNEASSEKSAEVGPWSEGSLSKKSSKPLRDTWFYFIPQESLNLYGTQSIHKTARGAQVFPESPQHRRKKMEGAGGGGRRRAGAVVRRGGGQRGEKQASKEGRKEGRWIGKKKKKFEMASCCCCCCCCTPGASPARPKPTHAPVYAPRAACVWCRCCKERTCTEKKRRRNIRINIWPGKKKVLEAGMQPGREARGKKRMRKEETAIGSHSILWRLNILPRRLSKFPLAFFFFYPCSCTFDTKTLSLAILVYDSPHLLYRINSLSTQVYLTFFT